MVNSGVVLAVLAVCLLPFVSSFSPICPLFLAPREHSSLGRPLPPSRFSRPERGQWVEGRSAGRSIGRASLGGLKMVDGYSGTVVDRVDNWVREQTIGALVSKKELKNFLHELDDDEDFWLSQKPKFDSVWKNVDAHLRLEDRPLAEVLRKGMTKTIADSIEKADIDKDTVKAFMRTKAVETMAGAILYTGIFEFMQRADFVGNAVNRLPVVGPIRQQFNKVLKDVIDQTLGSQVKDFLGTNSRPAVEQMIQFILAEENRPGFGKSARRVVEYLFGRPINSLLPSERTSLELRDQTWVAMRQFAGTMSDEEELLDSFFDRLGDKELGEFLPDIPPSAKRGLLKIWQKFLDHENGMDLSESTRSRTSRRRDDSSEL